MSDLTEKAINLNAEKREERRGVGDTTAEKSVDLLVACPNRADSTPYSHLAAVPEQQYPGANPKETNTVRRCSPHSSFLQSLLKLSTCKTKVMKILTVNPDESSRALDSTRRWAFRAVPGACA